MASYRNVRESDAPRRRTPTATLRAEENLESDGKAGRSPQSRGIVYGTEESSRRDLFVPVAYPVTHPVAHPVVQATTVHPEQVSSPDLENSSWSSSDREPEDSSVFQGESTFGTETSSVRGEYSVYSQAQTQMDSEDPSGALPQMSSRNTRNSSFSESPWDGPGRLEADAEKDKKLEHQRQRQRETAPMHDLPPYPYHDRQESAKSGLSHDLEGFSDFEPSVRTDSLAQQEGHGRGDSYQTSSVSRGVRGERVGGGGGGGPRPMMTGAEAAAAAEATNVAAAKAAKEKNDRARRQSLEALVSKPNTRGSSSAVRDRGEMKDEAAAGGVDGSNRGSSVFRQSLDEASLAHGDPYAPRVEYAVPTKNWVIFTPAIFFICVILLFWEFSLNDWVAEDLATNPSYGPSVETLIEAGAKRTDLILDNGDWWRLISPMFLHAGVVHFLFNMLGFIQVGSMVERVYGWWRIGSIYMCAGLFGTIVSAVFIPTQVMIGASGAIFGVFGALWADLFQNWTIYADKPRTLMMLTLLTIINIILGLMPYLDNFAHIGGMIMGFFMGLLVLVQKREDDRGMHVETKSYQKMLRLVSAVMVPLLFITGLSMLYGRSDPSEWCGWCESISCVEFPVDDPWWGCDECSTSGFTAKYYDNGTISILCPDQIRRYSDDCSSESDDALTECCIDLCL